MTSQPSEGQIDLPDQTLNFKMSTCSILPDSFIAAGSGTTVEGEAFFVKIESPGSMSIRFGVDDVDAVQPDDASFYRAVENARLVGADSMITGTIKVSDVNVAPDDEFDATIRIMCV